MKNHSEKKTRSLWILIAIQIIIVVLSAAAGFFLSQICMHSKGEFKLLQQANDILQNNTILELPSECVREYGMIRGLLGTLNDPYTIFVEPAANEIQSNELSGSFGGVGVRLEQDTQMSWRLYPLPESPAIEAGIKDGDLLVSVEDLSVTPDIDEVSLIAALRGPVGEKVKVSIQRDGEMFDFMIKRRSFSLPSVSYNLMPEETRIGMVIVNRISDTSADEVQNGIQALLEQGAHAFILDLRNNGGGLVDASIEITHLFLEDGEIMQRQFKDQEVEIFKIEKSGPFTQFPLVVLVNGNTASAAEIIAGAINKANRATLIGNPTFGKTTIQYIFDLDDSSSVHITSGHWWIAGQEFPLVPEVILAEDAANAAYLQAAIEILSKHLK
ncbi:MAG: S41 family peptidase [Chloroflexota bacterium]|nr:S41 family peptidase [Chloroflexota bacterium]